MTIEINETRHLREYQNEAVQFILDNECSYLAVDLGLGKTAITLTAISKLIKRDPRTKAIVFAPLRVGRFGWTGEIEHWSHLDNLRIQDCTKMTRNNFKKHINTTKNVFIVNTEKVIPFYEVREDCPLLDICNILVIDEASMFKAYNSKRSRYMTLMAKKFERRVLLSATPTSTSYYDLYSQYNILKLHLLGYSINLFSKQYFERKESYVNCYERVLKNGAEKQIVDIISPYTLRIRRDDVMTLPPIAYKQVPIRLDKDSKETYDKIKTGVMNFLSEANNQSTAKALISYQKLVQCANGFVYYEVKDKDTGDTVRALEVVHKLKLAALKELRAGIAGNVLLVYNYVNELEFLRELYPNLETLSADGGNVIRRWNDGEISELAISPKSAAHGINLQYGGNNIIWCSMTSSYESYVQLNGRIYRNGQTKPVDVYHLITKNTIEDVMLSKMSTRKSTLETLLDYLFKSRAGTIRLTLEGV